MSEPPVILTAFELPAFAAMLADMMRATRMPPDAYVLVEGALFALVETTITGSRVFRPASETELIALTVDLYADARRAGHAVDVRTAVSPRARVQLQCAFGGVPGSPAGVQ